MASQPYSGTNPIPKVSDFLRETAEKVEGKSHKEQAQEKANIASERKNVQQGHGSKGGNRRTVTDPTTGNEVEIEDTNHEFVKEAQKNDIVVPNVNFPDKKDSGQVGHLST